MEICGRCRRAVHFWRPRAIPAEGVLVVKPCSCGSLITHIWRPPSRWALLEIDR